MRSQRLMNRNQQQRKEDTQQMVTEQQRKKEEDEKKKQRGKLHAVVNEKKQQRLKSLPLGSHFAASAKGKHDSPSKKMLRHSKIRHLKYVFVKELAMTFFLTCFRTYCPTCSWTWFGPAF